MKEMRITATLDNLEVVTDFINEQLESVGCPMKTQMQICVAVEEVFVNIANYAYDSEPGDVAICVKKENPSIVSITFMDSGNPYDPLEKEDPDVSLSVDERQIGGLGIFMVKKLMDEVNYQYQEGRNVLEIRKFIK